MNVADNADFMFGLKMLPPHISKIEKRMEVVTLDHSFFSLYAHPLRSALNVELARCAHSRLIIRSLRALPRGKCMFGGALELCLSSSAYIYHIFAK